jgi:hypothetical protein
MTAAGLVLKYLTAMLSEDGFATDVANALSRVAFATVGVLIFVRQPQHPVGWLFYTAGLGWGVESLARTYAMYTLVVQPASLPAAESALRLLSWPVSVSQGLSVLLILLFPTGRLPSPRCSPVA